MREEKRLRDQDKKQKLERVTGGLAGANFGKDGRGIDNNIIDAILRDEDPFAAKEEEVQDTGTATKDELKVSNFVCDFEIQPPVSIFQMCL